MSVLPTISLPTASREKGLGSGSVDFGIAVLTGADIGPRGHIDVNYGIASIVPALGLPRYSQHLVSTSISAAATARWNPYMEVFWFRGPKRIKHLKRRSTVARSTKSDLASRLTAACRRVSAGLLRVLRSWRVVDCLRPGT
jgi:hypothetical protein